VSLPTLLAEVLGLTCYRAFLRTSNVQGTAHRQGLLVTPEGKEYGISVALSGQFSPWSEIPERSPTWLENQADELIWKSLRATAWLLENKEASADEVSKAVPAEWSVAMQCDPRFQDVPIGWVRYQRNAKDAALDGGWCEYSWRTA